MDSWLIVSLLEAFIIGGLLFLLFKIARILKREEAERRKEKMNQLRRGRGKPVEATVTRVIARGRMQYEIRAQWYGIETDNNYLFSETFWYYSGLLGMHPRITVGDTVKVTVNFRSPQIHVIERPW
jgi:hypothetical protein